MKSRLSDLLRRGRRSYWIVARGFVLNVRPAWIGWCWSIPGVSCGWAPVRAWAEFEGRFVGSNAKGR